jgi:hypothetical protein
MLGQRKIAGGGLAESVESVGQAETGRAAETRSRAREGGDAQQHRLRRLGLVFLKVGVTAAVAGAIATARWPQP